MKSCSITFKIKDYFPKIASIPFEEYACLFMNNDFNEKIPLIEKDYNTCKHQINNVNSDLKYKVHLVNINDFSLIGICEIVIPFAIISQIDIPGTFIKEQQLKLFIDLKTKRKLFGTIVSSGDIYLYISAEVFVNNKNNLEKKKKNIIKDRNGFKKDINNIIGNNLAVSKKNYRIIKTDKDSLRNECKTYSCLKNVIRSSTNTISNDFYYAPLSQERNDGKIIKHQSNPGKISYKTHLTIDNNNSNKNARNPNQKIKKIKTQRKKLTILDLMEQKFQNRNRNQLNFINKSNDIISKNNISKNSSPKELKNLNLDNKENYVINKEKNYYFFSDKTSNHSNNYGNILKNVFSPPNKSKNLFLNDKINYIYKKKSAQKIHSKISDHNIFNYNSSSPYSISHYLFNEEEKKEKETKNVGVKKIKSYSSKKILIENNNQNSYPINSNINNITDNSFIASNEEKQKLMTLDKTILEKGASLRNDFQNQLNYSYNRNKFFLESTYDDIYNNSNNTLNTRNINDFIKNNMNVRYNRSQKDFHKMIKQFNPHSPHLKMELESSKNNTNNMTPCSSTQQINIFTQEDLRNNVLNLLEFYSLLKKKINMVKENLTKNKEKLIIKKEKFNHQLKINNRLTQKIISVESKIILHATINCTLNEQIIQPLIKIKKSESNIYKNIFGLSFYDYDVMKFKEKEKNKLFEEQNIMHLLLIIIKNMVEHYGNISKFYQDNINKKKILQILLLKYEIMEKKEENANMDINTNKRNINNKYINYNKSEFSKFSHGQIIDDEFLNKFKIIREVEEDKEYDDSEEEEKIKKEIKDEKDIESLDIENSNENNINDVKNEKEIENGASKNEKEKSNKKNNNQFINDSYTEKNNKIELINKILFEEFPKKYPNQIKFIQKNKNEYIFGDNIVIIEMNNNNNLEIIINKTKYNIEDFINLFSNNNKKMDINELNKEEQINGIESTAVETEKSENLIKEKNEKNIKNIIQNNEEEENDDNFNSIRKQKRMKRKISVDDENENPNCKEFDIIKNGAYSNSETKNK